MKRLAQLCVALAAVALLTSCESIRPKPATPVGTYPLKRKLNAFQTIVNKPIEPVHKAVVQGLEDLKLRPITNRIDRLTGLVDGMMADGMDFEIKLNAMGPETTRLAIRCGMIGDEQRSRLLFSAIEKHLE